MKTFIKLEGKTRSGKNKIINHGSEWEVVQTKERVLFSPNAGPWLLLTSKDTGNVRWIHAKEDPDFQIVNLQTP